MADSEAIGSGCGQIRFVIVIDNTLQPYTEITETVGKYNAGFLYVYSKVYRSIAGCVMYCHFDKPVTRMPHSAASGEQLLGVQHR